MRNLRNSALAIATATTLTLGGMTVAGAQEAYVLPNNESNVNLSDTGSSAGSLGDALEFDQELNPRDIFGSDKSEFENAPLWGQVLYGTGIAAVAASIFGLVIAPIANFIYANFLAQ